MVVHALNSGTLETEARRLAGVQAGLNREMHREGYIMYNYNLFQSQNAWKDRDI